MHTFEKIHRDGPQIGNRNTSEPLGTLYLLLTLGILSCKDVCDDSKQYLILSKAARLWRHLKDRFLLWLMLVHGYLWESVTVLPVLICSRSEMSTLEDYYPNLQTLIPYTYLVLF